MFSCTFSSWITSLTISTAQTLEFKVSNSENLTAGKRTPCDPSRLWLVGSACAAAAGSGSAGFSAGCCFSTCSQAGFAGGAGTSAGSEGGFAGGADASAGAFGCLAGGGGTSAGSGGACASCAKGNTAGESLKVLRRKSGKVVLLGNGPYY